MKVNIICDKSKQPTTLEFHGDEERVTEVHCKHFAIDTNKCDIKEWPEPEAKNKESKWLDVVVNVVGGAVSPYSNPQQFFIHHSDICQFKQDEVLRRHIVKRVQALRSKEV